MAKVDPAEPVLRGVKIGEEWQPVRPGTFRVDHEGPLSDLLGSVFRFTSPNGTEFVVPMLSLAALRYDPPGQQASVTP